MMSLSAIPHAVVLRLLARSLEQRVDVKVILRHRLLAAPQRMVGAAHRRGQAPPQPRRLVTDRIATALAAARYQVMPSNTAVMAAARTAIVAVSAVTARADHRSSRSRRACATAARGKAEGIAGRISTRIIG